MVRILFVLMMLVFIPNTVIANQENSKNSKNTVEGQRLSGEHRSSQNRARDKFRNPKKTLDFFSVQTSSVVVEIWPGGGWYTEILAPLLRNKGKLYAAHFDANSKKNYFRKSIAAFQAKLKASPAVYDKVVVTSLAPPALVAIAPSASADFVLTFRNVHNWMKGNYEKAVFDSMYKALKSGGILGVVEHRAKPGTSLEAMIKSGYVTEDKVKQLASDAGFKFVASSEINANAKDSAQHPSGVWTLLPSLRGDEKDKKMYQAIGESDRMTLKFIKP